MNLTLDMLRNLGHGLQRSASSDCSRWAMNYLIMGKPVSGPMRFQKFPWSIDMLNEPGDWVGKKAAQMAYTNAALARAIFTIDVLGNDVLYVLPKRNPDASDFSKAKFDILLEFSPHIKALFSNVRNIGHKQAGNRNLFIRGARSRSALKSISVGLRIYDEFDEMPMKNVSLADERSSGYQREDKQRIALSTPTAPDWGIDEEFQKSTMEHFVFKCPSCSKMTELTFPECIVVTADSLSDEVGLRDSHLICRECKNKLPHETKADWLRHHSMGGTARWENIYNKQSFTRGFYINQLYSSTVEPWEIGKMILKARLDPADEQELYNSKMGLAHLVEGARVNDDMITSCKRNYSQKDALPRGLNLITMGVDVGKRIHYEIDQWFLPNPVGADLNVNAKAKLLLEGNCTNFDDLDKLIRQYNIVYTVIDANPETRKSRELALRFHGHVSLCSFHRGINGKNLSINEAEMTIGCHRTSWLDVSQGRFKNGSIELPYDISKEFSDHIKAPMRIITKDADENPVARYVSKGADHAAFARVYSEMALPMAVSISSGSDVSEFL